MICGYCGAELHKMKIVKSVWERAAIVREQLNVSIELVGLKMSERIKCLIRHGHKSYYGPLAQKQVNYEASADIGSQTAQFQKLCDKLIPMKETGL